jgi:hypothetical protein
MDQPSSAFRRGDASGNAQTVGGYDIVKLTGHNDLATLQRKLKCSLCGRREAVLSTIQANHLPTTRAST